MKKKRVFCNDQTSTYERFNAEIKAELNNAHNTSAPVDSKRDRVTISKQCLEMFQHNPDEFLHRFIIVETWIHYSTPEETMDFIR